MELGSELEGLVTRVIDMRRKNDECWGFNVQKGDLGFADDVSLANGETKSMKVEKCDVDCVNNVSISGDGSILSCADVVEDNGVKGSVDSVKCSEVEDEDMGVQDSIVEKDCVSRKRRRDCLSRMLQWVSNVAKDPSEPGIGSLPDSSKWKSYGNDECWKQVLSAREALTLKRPGVSSAEQPPWKRKHRMHPSMYDDQPASTERLRSSSRLLFDSAEYSPDQSSYSLSSSDRDASPSSFTNVQLHQRSLRCDISFMKSICPDHHIRKRIPVGPYFQVDVPEWTGKAASESDAKWLGTRIWPLEKRETRLLIERDPIGKGRLDSCGCQDRGSISCVRFHVAEKRIKLKLELGSAFYHWNFDKMGEEVMLSWTAEEEKKFRDTVKANPLSENKSFWAQMLKALPTKSRRDQVSYYYNVFLLQRRGYQNRCKTGDIDSEDDETELGKPCGTTSILGTPKKSHVKR